MRFGYEVPQLLQSPRNLPVSRWKEWPWRIPLQRGLLEWFVLEGIRGRGHLVELLGLIQVFVEVAGFGQQLLMMILD